MYQIYLNSMQPLIMLALVGVAAGALSMGFLAPGFTLNVQQLGAQETDLESPINTANVDFRIARMNVQGVGTHPAYANVISACSFHTPTTLETGTTIFCKLTDKDSDIVAEGHRDLQGTLVGSTTTYIAITDVAFPNANDVQNIEDVKIVILSNDPTP
jgi:hypothetical protein